MKSKAVSFFKLDVAFIREDPGPAITFMGLDDLKIELEREVTRKFYKIKDFKFFLIKVELRSL